MAMKAALLCIKNRAPYAFLLVILLCSLEYDCRKARLQLKADTLKVLRLFALPVDALKLPKVAMTESSTQMISGGL